MSEETLKNSNYQLDYKIKKLEMQKIKIHKRVGFSDPNPIIKNNIISPKMLKQKIELLVDGEKISKYLDIGLQENYLTTIEKITETKIEIDPTSIISQRNLAKKKIFITGIPEDCTKAKDLIKEVESGNMKVIIMLESKIPPPKIDPKNEKCLYIIIPEEYICVIIGKRGERIKQIQEESGAKILIANGTFKNKKNLKRRLSVYGLKESVSSAIFMIRKLLSNSGCSDKIIEYDPYSPKMIRNLTIPDELIPIIVGKSGETFLEIVRESQTQILINPSESGISPTRKISIFGTNTQVSTAIIIIDNLLIGHALRNGDNYIKNSCFSINGNSLTNIPDPGDPIYPDFMNYYYQYYFDHYINEEKNEKEAHKLAVKSIESHGIAYIPNMRVK